MGAHRRSERPRSQASYGPETGTTYLLHFDRPYGHARHYVGWTQDLAARLEAHARGRGARLVQVVVKAGIGFRLARTWPESTRDREDLIKHAGGARRYCPECGVKPRAQTTPQVPADDRRPMWMADRDGQWLDGTPIIYDPDLTWQQARQARAALQIPEPDAAGQAELAALDEVQRQWTTQEDHMNLKDIGARIVAPLRNGRTAREYQAAQAEADRLWAIADELDKQMGRQPGYQHELTAERAARIRALVGEDAARDAHIDAMPRAEGQPLEQWAITPDDVATPEREPVLEGPDLDAEIDRLADAFPEPVVQPERAVPWEQGEDAARWSPVLEAGDDDEAAYRSGEPAALGDGRYEMALDIVAEPVTERSVPGEPTHGSPERDEPWTRARAGSVGAARGAAMRAAYDGYREAGVVPAGGSPARAPVATTQLPGTPHTAPALADRGWQADSHGVYARNPDAKAPGGHRELAGYEAGTPDHMSGSPDCAEADPESAHFGRGPSEPVDTGRWPVLQADYGRMYIGPQAQAEAV